MEVLLITGFLGAGKTALIRHLLSSDFGRGKNVAVIVNEVGRTGIDGEVVSREGSALINLTGGGCSYEAVEEDHDTILVSVGSNFDEKRITEGLEKCFLWIRRCPDLSLQ